MGTGTQEFVIAQRRLGSESTLCWPPFTHVALAFGSCPPRARPRAGWARGKGHRAEVSGGAGCRPDPVVTASWGTGCPLWAWRPSPRVSGHVLCRCLLGHQQVHLLPFDQGGVDPRGHPTRAAACGTPWPETHPGPYQWLCNARAPSPPCPAATFPDRPMLRPLPASPRGAAAGLLLSLGPSC